ncbi:MAG: DUF2142 domain-containing protein [Mycobacteriales bacterium]
MTALPPGLRRYPLLVAFGLFAVALGSWSLATPLWGSPDEFQHVYRAYATAHGHLYIEPEPVLAGTGGVVQVPREWELSRRNIACYGAMPWISAGCAAPLNGDRTPVTVGSTAARYNPVYYLAVGWPSLVFSPEHSPYAMRVASSVLSAWFLAWAVTSALITRRPRLSGAAALLAITPMVVFMGAGVNPNGLEICAALACWVSLFALLTGADVSERVHTVLLRRTALSACALVVTRALSPLWLAVIVAVGLAIASRRHLRSFFRGAVLGWVGLVAVVSVAAVAWTHVAQTLTLNQLKNPSHYSLEQRLEFAWGGWTRQGKMWRGTVGNLGWLDTQLPPQVVYVWTAAALVVIVGALLFAAWRPRLSLGLAVVITISLPVLVEALNWNTSGPVWQPRYSLPLIAGVVAIAGILLAQADFRLGRFGLVASLLTICAAVWANVYGFVFTLVRNVAGLGNPFSLTGDWQPPVGAVPLTALNTAAWLAGATALYWFVSGAGLAGPARRALRSLADHAGSTCCGTRQDRVPDAHALRDRPQS